MVEATKSIRHVYAELWWCLQKTKIANCRLVIFGGRNFEKIGNTGNFFNFGCRHVVSCRENCREDVVRIVVRCRDRVVGNVVRCRDRVVGNVVSFRDRVVSLS